MNKYQEALNNLIGVDSAYYRGDKDIDLLQELVDRTERGCEYCNRPEKVNGAYSFFKNLPNWGDTGAIETCLRHSCGSWQLHSERVEIEDGELYCTFSDNIDIDFCPMCGKELR